MTIPWTALKDKIILNNGFLYFQTNSPGIEILEADVGVFLLFRSWFTAG